MADAALFHAGDFDRAAALAERSFGLFGASEDAYNAACSHARAGRPNEGLRWLERAVDAGYRAGDQLDTDPDLAAIRAVPGLAGVRAKLAGALRL